MNKEFKLSDEDIAEFHSLADAPISEADIKLPSENPNELMETAEDFGTGVVQGATLGTSPIIAGGIKGLVRSLTADSHSDLDAPGTIPTELDRLQILQDEYYKGRDKQLQKEDAAFDRSPVANFIGNVGGGAWLPSSALKSTASLGKKVLQGAKLGAAGGLTAGFGSGEGKLFGEDADLSQVVEETAKGGAIGGVIGGGLPIATKAITEGIPAVARKAKDAVMGTQSMRDLLDTYKFAKEGKGIFKKGASEQTLGEAQEFIESELIPNVKKVRDDSGEKIDDILAKADEITGEKDYTQQIKDLQDIIDNADPATEVGRKTIDEAQRFLNRYNKKVIVANKLRNEDPGEMTLGDYTEEIRTDGNITPSKAAKETRRAAEIFKQADVNQSGEGRHFAGKLHAGIKEIRDDLIPKNLLPEYNEANRISGATSEATNAIGFDAMTKPLDTVDAMREVNTLIKRFVSAPEDGRTADTVKQEMRVLTTQIRKFNPELAAKIDKVSEELSRRRELQAFVGRKTAFKGGLIGSFMDSTGRTALRAADALPGITKSTKQATNKFAEDLIGTTATDLIKRGSAKAGDVLMSAAKKVSDPELGQQAKAAARFAVSQQPAFRSEMKKQEESPKEDNFKLSDEDIKEFSLLSNESLSNESLAPVVDPLEAYNTKLAESESSGRYDAVSPSGTYIGKYQHGPIALNDIGYKGTQNNWLPSSGISSDAEYLANPELQEKVQREWIAKTDGYIKNKGLDKFVGKKIKYIDPNTGEVGVVKVSENGLRAAIHLNGIGAIEKMFQTGKVPVDGNKTAATTYLKKHAE